MIDCLYQKQRVQVRENLEVMDSQFKARPGDFQTVFRKNLHCFAHDLQLQQQSHLSALYQHQKSLLTHQQQQDRKLKQILKDYQIEIKDN